MKASLAEGLSATRRFEVDKAKTIDFMGDALRVYSTPALLLDIERHCREFLLEHLDEGEDTVGVRVELDHMAATLLGMWVDIGAKVVAVEGPKITLEIEARDPVETCCKCRHVRFVVNKEKQAGRLRSKAEKARQAAD